MLIFNYFGSNHRNPLLGYVLCNHFCYYWDRTSEITLPEFVVKINLLIYFQHQRHRHLHLTFKMYALLKCCWHYISLSTWRCINMSGFVFQWEHRLSFNFIIDTKPDRFVVCFEDCAFWLIKSEFNLWVVNLDFFLKM